MIKLSFIYLFLVRLASRDKSPITPNYDWEEDMEDPMERNIYMKKPRQKVSNNNFFI